MSKERRLIDANALELATYHIAQESEYARGWNDALYAAMINAPTVDAVEVVRCKDCKHLMLQNGCGMCALFNHYPGGMYYCASGERRNNG